MDSTLDFMSDEGESEQQQQNQQLLPPSERDGEQLEFGDLSHYFERHLLEEGGGPGATANFEGFGPPSLRVPNPATVVATTSPSLPLQGLSQGPHSLRGLLEANRKYQETLRDQIILLEEKQKAIKESLRWIHSQVTRSSARRTRSHLSSYLKQASALANASERASDWHQQTISEYYQLSIPPPRWSEEERAALAQGIRHQNQGILLDRLLPPGDWRLTSSEQVSSSEEYAQAVRTIQGMSQRQLENNLEGLDWGRVSRLFPSHHRNAIDCRIQWICNQHPLINHGPWTAEETKHLLALARDHGERQWVEVAEALGTNRTAWQCLARFRQASRPSPGAASASGTGGRKWTAAEDAILLSCVRPTGDWWLEAAERLDGRSTTQIIHRWNKTLDPTRRSGRWSPEEDACLLAAIRRYGTTNWAFIGRFVPKRTDMQCRERYLNVLSPSLRKDHFSEEEDRILREAVQQLGEGRWAQISALLPHRTDNQCRRRWLVISRLHGGEGKGSSTTIKGEKGRGAASSEQRHGAFSSSSTKTTTDGAPSSTPSRQTGKRAKRQ